MGIQSELKQTQYQKDTRTDLHSTKILKELKCEIADLLTKVLHQL